MTSLVLRKQRPWACVPAAGDVQKEFDRFVSNFFGDAGINPASAWLPAVDLRESEEQYTLVADLPGLKKEDIEISLTDDVVTIKGERKQEQEQNASGWHVFERNCGAFQRSFRLPRGVDGGNVNAKFENGVLTVTLPKPEQARKKQIEVKVN